MDELTGRHLLGSSTLGPSEKTFLAQNPATEELLVPAFFEADADIVNQAVQLANRDFRAFARTPTGQRAVLLEAIAAELLERKEGLVDRAHLETALPLPRLESELTRTVNQLRMFAQMLNRGESLELRINPALPDRNPLPRPDLRMTQVPLGPVAVFGASNFPLAFSVAGGDTASALAAGCPVVVKGHPAHPGTSELAGLAIQAAIISCGLPEGIFSLIQGSANEVGASLVKHPLIKAVAFTGSLAAGRSLYDLASSRPKPIPCYAEMGSVNPVFFLPEVLETTWGQLACSYADAVALGVGQFCTNPGISLVLKSAGTEQFIDRAGSCLKEKPAAAMVHAGIKQNYLQRLARQVDCSGVVTVATSPADNSRCYVSPTLLRTNAETFMQNPFLAEEVFGPSSLVVECSTFAEMQLVAERLPGQLTATVHASQNELGMAQQLFDVLGFKAGRLIMNGFPTGVEVCEAMVHGGPYPATTESRSTSVGTAAIKRFLRPVCYQNVPRNILPTELHDGGN